MTTNHVLKLYSGEDLVEDEEEFVLEEEPSARRVPHERIIIVGVGGGGNNALDFIIRNGIADVDVLGVNTDMRCLDNCLSPNKLILGEKLTKGLGAGARPDVGAQAALESREDIRAALKGYDMVYLAGGMGGGTGTGALPIIAQVAKELGILTVAVVTRPFTFEGKKRKLYADEGISKLSEIVDALLVVPNDKLLELSERTTSLSDAFAMADGVLRQAIKGVTDLVTRAGIINVDFADLRNVMQHAGPAVMGVGTACGENRLEQALKHAMESPLMECSMQGAKGVLFNITSSPDMGIVEMQMAADILREHLDPDANYIWGWVPDESMGDTVQVVVIATGFAQLSEKKSVARPVRAPEPSKPSERFTEFFDPSDTSVGVVSEDGSEFDKPAYLRRRRF